MVYLKVTSEEKCSYQKFSTPFMVKVSFLAFGF